MASATTTEFIKTDSRAEDPPFSLIEQKGLLRRLSEEVARAVEEVRRDPAAFFRGIFSADSKDQKRRRLIYAGLAVAAVAHAAMLVIVVVAGWHRIMEPVPESVSLRLKSMIQATPDAKVASESDQPAPETARGDNGGGGGGGDQTPRPPSMGVPPVMTPAPAIPAFKSPTMENPLLPLTPTLEGPQSEAPAPTEPIGDPAGKGTEFSQGSGKGGGIGTGEGPGVGPGKDGGAGPGRGGNRGDGTAGSPTGTLAGPSVVNWTNPPRSGYVPFAWLYKARPIVTPEAQASGSAGTVLLRATLNADGTYSDIEVINGVEHMTDSAVEALRRSKFRPATVDGRPVTLRRVLIKIEVRIGP
jgi:TonB family protein